VSLNQEKERKFFIGVCNLDLHIHHCQSLKEKRRVIKSLEEKLKNRFNISCCEFGDLNLWQRAQLAAITCSNEMNVVNSVMKAIIKFIEQHSSVTIVSSECRIL